jgi:hypothetical protein
VRSNCESWGLTVLLLCLDLNIAGIKELLLDQEKG